MLCVATAVDRIQRHKIRPVPFSSLVVGKWVSPRDAHRCSPCSSATEVWVFWFLTLATRKQRFVTPGNWLYKNSDNNKGLHAQSWLALAFWESSSIVVMLSLHGRTHSAMGRACLVPVAFCTSKSGTSTGLIISKSLQSRCSYCSNHRIKVNLVTKLLSFLY